jgi:hypothetical protein
MNAVHPRLQRRLEDTSRRRAEKRAAECERARSHLYSVLTLLQAFQGRVPAAVTAEMEVSCERLLGRLDRLRTMGGDEAEVERLTSDLNRLADDLLRLGAMLTVIR